MKRSRLVTLQRYTILCQKLKERVKRKGGYRSEEREREREREREKKKRVEGKRRGGEGRIVI